MPETKEYTIYKFEELSEKAKEKARQWYREMDNGDYWSEYVIEDAKTIGKLMGITVEKVYFRGFSSQGDGACFEGSWSAVDVENGKVKEHAPLDTELHAIASEFEEIAKKYPNANFSVKHSGHYYHEMSTSFDVVVCDGNEEVVSIEDAEAAEIQFIEAARDFMRWIYSSLEAAYDYEMSDECVDENIKANEYTFDENGERED